MIRKNQTLNFLILLYVCVTYISCNIKPIDTVNLESPDGNVSLQFNLNTGKQGSSKNIIDYSVYSSGNQIIAKSELGINFKDSPGLGSGLEIVEVNERSIKKSWERIWGRSKVVENRYNESSIILREHTNLKRTFSIVFRVYDDGVAFKYKLPEQENLGDFKITSENTEFNFTKDHIIWGAEYGFVSHQEDHFNKMNISDIDGRIMGLPLLVKVSDNQWAAITEANLTDWAGMYLSSASDSTLITKLAPRFDDSTIVVRSNEVRSTPWRVIMIANSAGFFLESNIIQNLNEPNVIEDVSWIKPGKSAWDWWWSNRYAPDANFKVGSNSETMKYYIDFANEMGWDYQLIDWDWYGKPFSRWEGDNPILDPDADILTQNPNINIPELVEYGKERDVKILLWLEWEHAEKQMEEAFPLYEKWGVAGVKVDFMIREDQEMVNFYHRLVKLAAKHHLIVNFHGAYKSTGISRTYPNLLTREGVMGNEYTKWSKEITPEHNTTIAFTRNILGEMDYTPGAFMNVTAEKFEGEEKAPYPEVMSTRAHQLAMMVVYESALQILCDSPYNYRNSPAGLNFLKEVPTTWDETRFIQGEIGEYITVARRKGNEWFVGTLNNSTSREVEIRLFFLDDGNYNAHIWKDGDDADTNPRNILEDNIAVSSKETLKVRLAIGGGHVMILEKD